MTVLPVGHTPTVGQREEVYHLDVVMVLENGALLLSTFANTMNVVLMGVSVLFLLVAMVFGAAAYKNWFRFYSIGTFLVFLVEDILATLGAPQAIAGQPGPLVGIQERTMIYGCLLWVVVLAIVLLRAKAVPNFKEERSDNNNIDVSENHQKFK